MTAQPPPSPVVGLPSMKPHLALRFMPTSRSQVASMGRGKLGHHGLTSFVCPTILFLTIIILLAVVGLLVGLLAVSSVSPAIFYRFSASCPIPTEEVRRSGRLTTTTTTTTMAEQLAAKKTIPTAKTARVMLANEERLDFEDQTPECANIDVAIICVGNKAMRIVDAMMKSLLLANLRHRLTIHAFVEGECSTWFNTFVDQLGNRVPQVAFRIQSIREWGNYKTEAVRFVGKHYSGPHAMMKLDLPELLPDVEKAIYLDTDIQLLSPIHLLWSHFTRFAGDQAIGAAYDMNAWYQGNGKGNHWPGMDKNRGINTGVLLLHLDRLRSGNWTGEWRASGDQMMAKRDDQKPPLPDQDIINAALRARRFLFYEIPCTFNLQMNAAQRAPYCPVDEVIDVHIAHFNSGSKRSVLSRKGATEKRMRLLVDRLYAMTTDQLLERLARQPCFEVIRGRETLY